VIEDDGARAGGALIEREDERHGRSLYNASRKQGTVGCVVKRQTQHLARDTHHADGAHSTLM
jgi:hypothetical protein